MASPEEEALGWASPAVLAVAHRLAGLSLLAADMVLDEARRFAWMKSFSGRSEAEIQAELKAPPVALQVAGFLEGRTLLELNDLLEQVRLFLWSSNFTCIPDSAFARQLGEYAATGAVTPPQRTKH